MKQVGTISCQALQRGSLSLVFLLHVKTERTNSSLLEGIGVQQSIRFVVIFTFQRVLSPHVIYFFAYFTSLIVTY